MKWPYLMDDKMADKMADELQCRKFRVTNINSYFAYCGPPIELLLGSKILRVL